MQTNAVTFLNDNRASFVQIGTHVAHSSEKAQEAQQTKPKAVHFQESESIDEIKAILQEHSISLQFSTDSATNAVVVKMVDEKTGEAIRQFPSEVSLKLAANFQKLQGNFINKTE